MVPIPGAWIAIRVAGIGGTTSAQDLHLLTNAPCGRLETRAVISGYPVVTVAAGATEPANSRLHVRAIEPEELVAAAYARQTRRGVGSAINTVDGVDPENPAVASVDSAHCSAWGRLPRRRCPHPLH